jgi:hypothetical protein
MDYSSIAPEIEAWVRANSLVLGTKWANAEARFVHVSSEAGECFQIWIHPPAEGRVCIAARCIEGRGDDEDGQTWSVPIEEISAGLKAAMRTVVGWMAPSRRHYPDMKTPSKLQPR